MLKVRSHPYLLLEDLSLPRHQGICFGDDWDNVDLFMHCPEESHIQGPKPAAGIYQAQLLSAEVYTSPPQSLAPPQGALQTLCQKVR